MKSFFVGQLEKKNILKNIFKVGFTIRLTNYTVIFNVPITV